MTLNTETANVQTMAVFSKSSNPEKIMKIARRQFAGTHNVPAKVEEIETVEKLYVVDTETFIANAEKIDKARDIKGDAITRKIRAYNVHVLCLDTDTAMPATVKLMTTTKNPEKALKESRKKIEKPLVPCKVTFFEIIEQTYGMTVEKFIHIAKEVTKQKK